MFSSEGITDIFEKVYSIKDGRDEPVRLVVNSKFLNEVKAKAVVTPQSLPMVYPPAIWGENKTGGFLTNIVDHKSLVTGSAQHNHKINLNDATYDSINYLNSQSFEVNSELHNYIVNEGNYIIDYIREHDNKNYFNFLLTLDIAKTYLNQNIYLNVNIYFVYFLMEDFRVF